MKFVHPEILWALSALSIPIIVHLFNFRKFKKVFFSNVEFLKEIKQETQSKSKLKHLLILISRILAMACIIFAFAQPFIPNPGTSKKPGSVAVSIYIDNSFSMQAEGKEGRLLEIAKNKAIEIVNSYKPSDKFQLLTSDFEGRHQRLVSREEMTNLIQEVKESPVSRKLSEVVSRQRDLLSNSGIENKRAFILTDLQKTVTDVDGIVNDTTIQFNLVPDRAENVSNIFIDSVWFETPVRQLNQPEVMHARIINTGSEKVESIPVQLNVNGVQKSIASAAIEAQSNSDIQITFTNSESGFKNGVLSIDDQSITKDDKYYLSYNVLDKINLLELRGKDMEVEAVRAVFSDDPYFVFSSMGEENIDFGAFPNQNLIVLNQLKNIPSGLADELEKFVQGGGSVFIIPASEIVMNEYNAVLAKFSMGQILGKNPNSTKVNGVNYDHFIFKNAFEKNTGNVDLPVVNASYEVSLGSKTSAEPMMTLQSGAPFMISSVFGNGRVYFSAVSLKTEESNFINHAFFPATLLRMAEFSQPSARLAYTLGKEQAILLRNLNMEGEETFRLKNIQNGQEFIPEHRNAGGNVEIYLRGNQADAGNYALSWGNKEVDALAFNYDRAESYNASYDPDDVKTKLDASGWSNWNVLSSSVENIAAGTDELSEGKKYWLTMIISSLIFLAIEVLLIKFWR